MSLHRKFLIVLICFLSATFYAQNIKNDAPNFLLLTTQNIFKAGTEIILSFESSTNIKPQLYCSNSYGNTLVTPVLKDERLTYRIPKFITKKRGIVFWKLITEQNQISGNFEITPQLKANSLETYLGPPSIEAGGTDFTMLVVIPTDSLDNPLPENTVVNTKRQFLKDKIGEDINTKNLLGFKNIFSPNKDGRMIISSSTSSLNSKEFDVNVAPAIATNFEIFVDRNHEYADGNQISTFSTSVIKDKNNNIISDGSFVYFYITNSKNNVLKTTGTTINGVAKAKMIHPDHEETWQVKAYFLGIAESNIITVSYKKAVQDFSVTFSKDNRMLTVGPLKSFMNQLIPDGLQVKLTISKDKKIIKTILKESKYGFAKFMLDKNIYKNGNYDLEISTAGIIKTFNAKKLW